jgi:hypothetical protein
MKTTTTNQKAKSDSQRIVGRYNIAREVALYAEKFNLAATATGGGFDYVTLVTKEGQQLVLLQDSTNSENRCYDPQPDNLSQMCEVRWHRFADEWTEDSTVFFVGGCAACIHFMANYEKWIALDLHEGSLVRLARDVERFPHCIVKKGATGIVTKVGDFPDEAWWVKLDEYVDGLNEWNNELQWIDDTLADMGGDLEVRNPQEQIALAKKG